MMKKYMTVTCCVLIESVHDSFGLIRSNLCTTALKDRRSLSMMLMVYLGCVVIAVLLL